MIKNKDRGSKIWSRFMLCSQCGARKANAKDG
nr:MAG TPA: Scavenger receptor cysteine-rich domain [Caudoviricetes sp.]